MSVIQSVRRELSQRIVERRAERQAERQAEQSEREATRQKPRQGEQFFFAVHVLPMQSIYNKIAGLRNKIALIEREERRAPQKKRELLQQEQHKQELLRRAKEQQSKEELRQRVATSRAQSQQVFLELQILREKRRADDKTEQIASREKQRAQYAKELPGKQEETRRVIRQMQQERANRTGEDVNEIARQAEEQHKAFTERPKQEPNTRVLMKCYTFRELMEIGRVKDDDNEELLLQPLQAQAIALENL